MIGRILYRKAISRLLDHILSKKRKTRDVRETHPDIRRGATARDMRASTRLASGAAPVSARAGAAPRTRGARGGADASRVVPSPQCSVGTLKRSRSFAARALARGRDAAYYEWIDAKGIEAPSIGIGYVGGGIADDNETYRGCVATAPIAAGTSWGFPIARSFLESSREVMEVEASPKRFAFFSSRGLERRVCDPLPSPRARRAPRRNVFLPVRPSRCR